MTRQGYNEWKDQGSKDIMKRIQEKIREILETHEVTPLAEKTKVELGSIKKGSRELT